jgi:hypothetical protein
MVGTSVEDGNYRRSKSKASEGIFCIAPEISTNSVGSGIEAGLCGKVFYFTICSTAGEG